MKCHRAVTHRNVATSGSSSRHHDLSVVSNSQLFGVSTQSSRCVIEYESPPKSSRSCPGGSTQKSGFICGEMSDDVSPWFHAHTPEVRLPYTTPMLDAVGAWPMSEPVTIGSE